MANFLIVEDDSILQQLFEKQLERLGHNPFAVVSAEDAIEILKTERIRHYRK